MLVASGVPALILEPFPGRGSVVARLRGDGTGGDPLLLLSHLDVVPAAGSWSHEPFAADLADGYVWGRGAVDIKDLVAMEIEVVRLLAEESAAARPDPARPPLHGLARHVPLASTDVADAH